MNPFGGAQALQELPVKPFFFAKVDLIEHFLEWREESRSLLNTASGESRPDGAVEGAAEQIILR